MLLAPRFGGVLLPGKSVREADRGDSWREHRARGYRREGGSEEEEVSEGREEAGRRERGERERRERGGSCSAQAQPEPLTPTLAYPPFPTPATVVYPPYPAPPHPAYLSMSRGLFRVVRNIKIT